MNIGWNAKMARGVAIAMLMAGTACQRSEGDSTAGSGGMFGTARPAQNGATSGPAAGPGVPAALRTDPGAAPGPAVAPSAPGPAVAPAGPSAAPAAQDRRIRVNNNSGQTITLIKGSASNDNDWGQDRIPSGVLQTGNSVIIDFNDGNGECVYDLRATMIDGTERVQRAVNICTVVDWVVTPSGSEVR